jgi:hypothetical protein
MIGIEYITTILLIIYSSIMIAVLKQTCDKSNNELYDTLLANYASILSLTIICFIFISPYPRFGVFILGIILGTLLWLLPISYNIYVKNDKASCLYKISIVNFTFTSVFLLLILSSMFKLKNNIFNLCPSKLKVATF